jgi:uncharacterized membrane protein
VGNLVKTLLTQQDLKEIADAIVKAEHLTSGEIRVEIRQRRSRRERSMSIEELARRQFHHLGMTQTKERNGVLLFLLLEDRELHILGDEGIHSKAGPETWQQIADGMISWFSKRKFREGLIEAVHEVGDLLAQHFPRRPDDTNELANEVRIR